VLERGPNLKDIIHLGREAVDLCANGEKGDDSQPGRGGVAKIKKTEKGTGFAS